MLWKLKYGKIQLGLDLTRRPDQQFIHSLDHLERRNFVKNVIKYRKRRWVPFRLGPRLSHPHCLLDEDRQSRTRQYLPPAEQHHLPSQHLAWVWAPRLRVAHPVGFLPGLGCKIHVDNSTCEPIDQHPQIVKRKGQESFEAVFETQVICEESWDSMLHRSDPPCRRALLPKVKQPNLTLELRFWWVTWNYC